MENNPQLNTPPNTGPTKHKGTSGRTDFDVTPEEHIDRMTELGQDQAILRQRLDELDQKVCTLKRSADYVKRIQQQTKISLSQIHNSTINIHRHIQTLERKAQEVQKTQRQNQTKLLQDLSTSGAENAGNTRIKSDSQNSKLGVRIKAETSELKFSKLDREQHK